MTETIESRTCTFYFLLYLFVFTKQLCRKIDFKLILLLIQKYCFILLLLMNGLLQRTVIFMTVQFNNKYPISNVKVITNQLSQFFIIIITYSIYI